MCERPAASSSGFRLAAPPFVTADDSLPANPAHSPQPHARTGLSSAIVAFRVPLPLGLVQERMAGHGLAGKLGAVAPGLRHVPEAEEGGAGTVLMLAGRKEAELGPAGRQRVLELVRGAFRYAVSLNQSFAGAWGVL